MIVMNTFGETWTCFENPRLGRGCPTVCRLPNPRVAFPRVPPADYVWPPTTKKIHCYRGDKREEGDIYRNVV